MLDVIYVVATLAFFALMLGYVSSARSSVAADGQHLFRAEGMSAETIGTLIVAACVLGYLVYTLLRPEKF